MQARTGLKTHPGAGVKITLAQELEQREGVQTPDRRASGELHSSSVTQRLPHLHSKVSQGALPLLHTSLLTFVRVKVNLWRFKVVSMQYF